jgi:ABC-type sulfate transport system permease component
LEKDGKVIGTGSLVGTDILGVFVHPRFQHQGYGKAIMCATSLIMIVFLTIIG